MASAKARAPKVVLAEDPHIPAGVPCEVRVRAVRKGSRSDHGYIEVNFLRPVQFQLEGVYLDELTTKKLRILLESGLNILLDGPQGSGKTTVARAIAQTLDLTFVFFNCAAVVEPTDFLATIQVTASPSGHPVTAFVKTRLLEALEEARDHPDQRYLVFLDELNRATESARNVLMPALDSTRRIFNPVSNDFLDIPDNVQFIAAVNRGEEFFGTFGIDAAQLDRFAPVAMDYLPPAEEVKLLQQRHPELAKELIQVVVHVADHVRRDDRLTRGLSVRATDEVCIYLKHPPVQQSNLSMLGEILKASFCGRFHGRWDEAGSDAGVVWEIIQHQTGKQRRGGVSGRDPER